VSWTRSHARHADALAHLGGGPWSRENLLALGWTSRQIERDVEAGRLVGVRRGLYRPVTVAPDWTLPETYAPFVAQTGAPAVVSHESAARVHALWLPSGADERVHLTTAGRPLPTDAAVRRHRAALPTGEVVLLGGVPVTSVTRTAVDLALGRQLPQALVVLDSAARRLALGEAWRTSAGRAMLSRPGGERRAHRAQQLLGQAARGAARRPGARSLRRALPWVDPRSESPYESWSRGTLVVAGLAPEAVGFAVVGASGRQYFADMAWPSWKLIAEVDGLTKYGDDPRTVRERLQAERHRQADLEDAGWAVVRWTAGERGAAIVARVKRGLHTAAA
jgi:hypothetical protein